jgi:hypothetical protein
MFRVQNETFLPFGFCKHLKTGECALDVAMVYFLKGLTVRDLEYQFFVAIGNLKTSQLFADKI